MSCAAASDVVQSKQVMEIFARFDENMAAASLDEAYLKWVE